MKLWLPYALLLFAFSAGAKDPAQCSELLSFTPAGPSEVISEKPGRFSSDRSGEIDLPATIYELKFKNGHRVRVIDASNDNRLGYRKLDRIQAMLAALPDRHIQAVDQIEIVPGSWAKDWFFNRLYRQEGRFAPSISAAGDKRITFFNNSRLGDEPQLIPENFFHEFGHLVAENCFSEWEPPESWLRILRKEGSVNAYGDKYSAEDFAESVFVYLSSTLDGTHALMRKKYPLRFQYLDDLFARRPGILTDLRRFFRIK